jgi:PAS domain S-box-containing protein
VKHSSKCLLYINYLIEKKGSWLLNVFTAIIGIYVFFEMSEPLHQILAAFFTVTFFLSSIFRKRHLLLYPLLTASILLLTLITIFSNIDFFTLLSIAYYFLIVSAFLLPNPFVNLLVGAVFVSLLLTYQDSISIYHIKGNIISVAVNTIFYSVFAYLIRYLFQKKIELQESERSNHLLLSLLPDPIVIHQNGKMVYVNTEGLKLFGGVNLDDVVGKSVYDLIQPSYHEIVTERIYKTLKGSKSITPIEIKISNLFQEVIDIETIPVAINYKGKPAVLTVVRDITDIKMQTEKLIEKSDKLSLVGQLAAGIAHEIRNPLTSLRGFIQLLQYKSDENKEYCEIMLSELDRINLIVGEFLILAKPQMVNYSHKDINEIIRHVVTLIGTQAIMNNIDMSYKLADNLPTISCEENQLKQVIINLIKNAIEAMPHGGTITVETGIHDEKNVFIKIKDEGYGIPEEMLTKLGEPFYTTKDQGTGLGLMVCYNIVESHHGQLNVYSEINKGTTFEMILPNSITEQEALKIS